MAVFDYNRLHSRAFYAKGDKGGLRRGAIYWCHNKEDELRAKELGYTSEVPIPTEWPKTAFHRETGETVVVGKFEFTDEANVAAVANLGPEWTLDYVEPPKAKPSKAGATNPDLTAVLSAMLELKEFREEMQGLRDEVTELREQRTALESRLAEVEGAVSDPVGASTK